MNEEEKPFTLSREDLYELAWSKPMSELAKDFGISDVGLAKRCKRLGIPVPGRGYWARIEAGQTPYRPKLPNREAKWHDRNALTVAPPQEDPHPCPLSTLSEESSPAGPPPGPLSPNVERGKTIPERIAALAITPTRSILDALPAVRRTALRLKHPQRSELKFQRGEKTGEVVATNVSQEAADRALLLADTLLRAAHTLGWEFDDPVALRKASPPDGSHPSPRERRGDGGENPQDKNSDDPLTGRLLVAGEQIAFQIEERFKEEPCQPTAAQLAREKREYRYHAPRTIAVATGNLRVVRLDAHRAYGGPERRSWYDRKGSRVEDKIRDILLGFYELALSTRARREKVEREMREREEQERIQKECEARQEANEKLIKQLETDAGAWHRARYLRRYVLAARRAVQQARRNGDKISGAETSGAGVGGFGGLGTVPEWQGEVVRVPPPLSALEEREGPTRREGEDFSIRARFLGEVVDFLDWAERYVNQLDPLHAAPRGEEFEKSGVFHYHTDLDRMKKAFARLLGSEWTDAWKLGKDYSPPPKSARRWYYGERSVFEVDGGDDEGED